MALDFPQPLASLRHERLGKLERQLLREAAPEGSVPGTLILPALSPSHEASPDEQIATGEATRRAVRRLVRLELVEVTEPPVRISHRVVQDTVGRLLWTARRESWPPGLPDSDDAATRFLALALKPRGRRPAAEVIRLRSVALNAYLAGNDPRLVLDRARALRTEALKQVRPYLRLRNMRRTELGDLIVAYDDETEAALSEQLPSADPSRSYSLA